MLSSMVGGGDLLRRRNSSNPSNTRRIFWKVLFVILPSYIILRLHWGLDDMDLTGLWTDHTDFFEIDLMAPVYPASSSRHLASSDPLPSEPLPNEELPVRPSSNNKAIQTAILTAEAEAAADKTDTTLRLRTPTTSIGTDIKKPAAYAQMSLSDRKPRPTPTKIDNDDDKASNSSGKGNYDDDGDDDSEGDDEEEENENDEEKEAKRQLEKRKRQQQARRRRERQQQDEEDAVGWLAHPENITDYFYVPIGKYVLRDLERRTVVTANHHNSNETTATSPYAYAFVMGGVNEQDGSYLGMLYNVLIAAYILDKEGSSADIVLYVQMGANSTLMELPPDDTRLLEILDVKIRYLPKPKVENFHQIIMQKMVVLELVEYRRVIFLDTDVMPFCNLDYVFRLSDGPRPILKKNLIIALSGSPANAGFWMVTPKPDELTQLQALVASQQAKAKKLPYPHFDDNIGWGHVIRSPDMWWTINKKHTRRRWKFVGSHADQGLLYHWVKYVKRSVSIVSGVEVDNYGPVRTREKIRLEKTLESPFAAHTCLPEKYEATFGLLPTPDARGMAPYRDFVHFLGGKKPWKNRLPPPVSTNIDALNPDQYWFFMLRLLNKELDMGIDFSNWKTIEKTPLGGLPKKELMLELIHANQTLLQS